MMELVKVKFLVDFSERENAPKKDDVIEVDKDQANIWIDNNIVKLVKGAK